MYRGCCPARAAGRLPGAGHGVRGVPPLHPLHPRTPLCAGTRNLSLESGCTPSAACRMRHRRGPSRLCRVMSAPAAALRPPCGRPGSPSRPRHRCIATSLHQRQGAEGLALPGGSKGGKLADGRAAVLALTPGRAALCHRLKFHLFSKLKRSRRAY